MPFYEYQCTRCAHEFEAMQKIAAAPLRKCPACGKTALKRLVSAPVFRLKGGGWYETDFKSDKEGKRNIHAAEQGEAAKSEPAAADTKAAKPDAAPAPAAPAPATPSAAAPGAAKAPSRRASPAPSRQRAKRPAATRRPKSTRRR